MAYKVKTESFEGPFDLLLYLVSRQKVDIGAISIAEIADQYLDEIASMGNVDLDVASDFLLVASTLLEIKAASLIPSQKSDVEEELEELNPDQARDILIQRLLSYKQFKNAAADLQERFELQGWKHTRPFGPDESLTRLVPDYLEGVSLDGLANLCATLMGRRSRFLLESEHIAAKPIPVEMHVRAIHTRLKVEKQVHFSELIARQPQIPIIVVTFLAVLELYKRGMVTVVQDDTFGDICIDFIEGSGELFFDGEEAITSVNEG